MYNLSGETEVMAALTGLVMQTQLVSRRATGHGDPQEHAKPQFQGQDLLSLELKQLLEVGLGF